MSTFDPQRPFRFRTGVAAGITAAALKNPARYRRLFQGVYLAAGATPTLRLRAEAALLLHPEGAFASHSTAATLHGLAVPTDPDVHITVSDARHRRPQPGLRCHVRRDARVARSTGLPVSDAGELFLELAQNHALLDLVIAGDGLVSRNGLLPGDLMITSGRGSVYARRAAHLVRAGVESPMETRVRLLLRWAGFPDPQINLTLAHDTGTYRQDLCWPAIRLAVEYDGQHHRSDLDQWDSDITRREWFHRNGWTVVTLISRDVYRRPEETLRRVYAEWRTRGGRPFVLRDDWRAHFEGS